ncbi:hypothetical protein HanXRQr2_Chr13g0584281 [Helianthus annuus]|uniref:Uncharacterized protein n=1 Tax=Helianthus annuus TaxID=4232 RepID=A0A9K3EIU6_HELAN|nr:hypothetical protein HanXRQr2_Chr13g0584281 [Helianthus annuus]
MNPLGLEKKLVRIYQNEPTERSSWIHHCSHPTPYFFTLITLKITIFSLSFSIK